MTSGPAFLSCASYSLIASDGDPHVPSGKPEERAAKQHTNREPPRNGSQLRGKRRNHGGQIEHDTRTSEDERKDSQQTTLETNAFLHFSIPPISIIPLFISRSQ